MWPEVTTLDDVYGPDEFALDVGATPAQLDDVRSYRDLLESWNGRMNLVGPSALPTFWKRHALDSAQLLHVEQSASVWADIGSGAGLPGILLAILLKDRPGAEIHLIESMAKRVRFLEAVASELHLPVTIHHARAEAVPPPKRLQVVTARACAPMSRLFSYTQHLFRPGVQGLFLKGRDARAELTEAEQDWTFDADLIASRSDPSGFVVRTRRLAPRGR